MDYKADFQSDDDFDCSNSYYDSYTNNYNNNNQYTNSDINRNNQTNETNPNGLSKAELRKTNKPIMEKRRRARINHCLNELKSLILEAMKKDPARHTKLEKADILEMTVKHLQSIQRQQLNIALQTDPSVIHKFKTGFIECAEEVNRYVTQIEGVDQTVRQRLTSHLNSCASNLEQLGTMTNFNNSYRSHLAAAEIPKNTVTSASVVYGNTFNSALNGAALPIHEGGLLPTAPQDLNNNSNSVAAIQMGGLNLVPSRLPTGEFALIIPKNPADYIGNNHVQNQINNNITQGHWLDSQRLPAAASLQLPMAASNKMVKTDLHCNFSRTSAFSKPTTHVPVAELPKHAQAPSISNLHHAPAETTTIAHSVQTARADVQQHNTTATTSPPLSPISSVSSHGDDSIMHTSSDFPVSRPTTPTHEAKAMLHFQQQQQSVQEKLNVQLQKHEELHNFSGVFPTPSPSSAESSFSSTASSSARSSLNMQQEQRPTVKRAIMDEASLSCDSSEYKPSPKKIKTETKPGAEADEDEGDNMWRPW